ncbi:MAG: hypothetical protein U9R21_05270 [Candidatus Thermoplasmatota archaeon]|nr:hypothetical protein [Candidatus Thermoplasmatota archaeon]
MAEDLRSQAKKEAGEDIKKGLPKLVFTAVAAVLIWVFGNLVFMPLAQGLSVYQWPLDRIVSLVILSALILIILRAMLALTRIADGISTFLAVEFSRVRKEFNRDILNRYRSFLRGIVYAIMMILIFILVQDYLTYIHPALSGIVLLIIVIWAILLLYRGGTKISGEITKTLDHLSKEAISLIEGEEEEKKK